MIVRVTYVRCDGCGAGDTTKMAHAGATAPEQRVVLREMGWQHTADGDHCPTCARQRVAEYVNRSRYEQGFVDA